ncbi:hypothetical protein [Niallia taxi]|nr:hypothetical protein [Niallia taxi]
MIKKNAEANKSSHKKDKSKAKGKSPLMMISSGLSKAQADKMAKLSK